VRKRKKGKESIRFVMRMTLEEMENEERRKRPKKGRTDEILDSD